MVSAAGAILDRPLAGAGGANRACGASAVLPAGEPNDDAVRVGFVQIDGIPNAILECEDKVISLPPNVYQCCSMGTARDRDYESD